MIYITFIRKPFPCISVQLKILPPLIDFILLVVAAPTLGFLVLAITSIPINGAATLTAGLRNFLQAVCVPLNTFSKLLLFDPPSS